MDINAAKKIKDCFKSIRSLTDFCPSIAVVLGSGFGSFSKEIEINCEISYSDIPGFPVSTVQGHSGKFVFGYVESTPVVLMQGRVHFYEGYDMSDVVLPVRLLVMLGAKKIILTNAAGGINEDLCKGDLMLITDHISSFVPSPLRGENIDFLGTRFPDMSCVYSKEMIESIEKHAASLDINLKNGVYLQAPGPNYETPAEIRAYRLFGADAVGMSTVCEAIAAHHAGAQVAGISCITNMAAGMQASLSHDEVILTANGVSEKKTALLRAIIANG